MPARIAICLFEDTIDTFDIENLMGGNLPAKVNLSAEDASIVLYLKSSSVSTPEWVDIVKGFSDINTADTITASSGAILFCKIKSRIFGCCFGSSVGNINRENIVTDFGLAVAYNKISNKNYKTIETYALSENPITNNRSIAMPSAQNSFNLDSYLETITELSGKYYSDTKSILVKGKEFFSIPAPLTLDKIKELCATLLENYEITIANDEYKKLTAVSKVKSKKLIEFLNDELCKALNKKSLSIHLLDYQQFDSLESYSLTPKGEKLMEIEIGSIYTDINRTQKFTIDYLKSKKINLYDQDGQFLQDWSLYKCLFTEISINVGGYILYKGNWYEVQKRYLSDLKNFVSRYEIDSATLNLLPWDGKQKEADYNLAAAASAGAQCWDKILYSHPDFSYGIEFCDLLLPSYVIHVKKLASSSLNSHLLMQTYVSAQLLRSDLEIKNWIQTKSKKIFKNSILLKPSNEFKQQPVSYVIALMAKPTKKSLAESLPFFSLITFNMLIRRILQLEFDVKICKV